MKRGRRPPVRAWRVKPPQRSHPFPSRPLSSSPQGPPHPPALYLHLRSPAVRFVHLPPSINPRTAVDDAERAASAARAAARRAVLAAEGRVGRLGKGMDAEVGAFGGSAGLDGDQEEGWAEEEEEGGAGAAAGGGG